MRIWCISDTHGKHGSLDLPNPADIDMVLHTGDASCVQETSFNDAEIREFISWFSSLPYKYKVYIPGNHDTSVEAGMHTFPDDMHVLIHEAIEIEGIKFFGSPYTPSFGYGWAYNMKLNKIRNAWESIPEDTDILATHGPARRMLDLCGSDRTQAGCPHLKNRINRITPSVHVFGHIHNEDGINNAGLFKPSGVLTTYVNASVVDLGHEVVNNGVVINFIKQ